MVGGSLPPATFRDWRNRRSHAVSKTEARQESEMPDVDLVNRHPALQSMCSKD
jgi:hypothetical protein